MSSSFISERSAEYILIPKFHDILSIISNKLTPIYFWTTREGASLSKESFKNKPVYIIAFYARRPKMRSVDSETIEVKFNGELFERSKYLFENGIPTFSGVPLISKLDELRLGANCKWFSILPTGISFDEYLLFDKFGTVIDGFATSIQEVNKTEIIKFIEHNATILTWADAIKILRNNKTKQNTKWFFGGGYKPVYFIVDISEKR